jgi:hypothetical protein
MENNFQQTDQKNVILNKRLRLSATITMVLGFFSVHHKRTQRTFETASWD